MTQLLSQFVLKLSVMKIATDLGSIIIDHISNVMTDMPATPDNEIHWSDIKCTLKY